MDVLVVLGKRLEPSNKLRWLGKPMIWNPCTGWWQKSRWDRSSPRYQRVWDGESKALGDRIVAMTLAVEVPIGHEPVAPVSIPVAVSSDVMETLVTLVISCLVNVTTIRSLMNVAESEVSNLTPLSSARKVITSRQLSNATVCH